ncbi:MAG: hypothetical protein R3B71_01590 [Candidatus Gracilibacteria bacterium]
MSLGELIGITKKVKNLNKEIGDRLNWWETVYHSDERIEFNRIFTVREDSEPLKAVLLDNGLLMGGSSRLK